MLKYCVLPLLLGTAAALTAQTATSFELKRDVTSASGEQTSGDFNQDGKLDLVSVAGYPNYSLVIRYGNGDGTFQAPRSVASATGGLGSLVTADINHDGRLDVAALDNQGLVDIFFGNGNGTFQPVVTVATTSSPQTLAVGDFNGDRLLDLAVGESDGGIEVYNNVGGRNFTPVRKVFPGATSGNQVLTLNAADFDGNGTVDLAVGTYHGAYVLWGDGHSNFTPVLLKSYPGITYPGAYTSVGDVNQEGNPDILVETDCDTTPAGAGNGPGNICADIDIFYGGRGFQKTFYRHAVTQQGTLIQPVQAVDVNGDGIADLVASGEDSGGSQHGLFIYLGHPDGTFDQTAQRFIATSNGVGQLVSGDFNRDGKMDFVQLLYSDAAIQIYLNATHNAPCATSAINPTVTVCSPVDGTYSLSPVHIQANAYDTTKVTALQEYINGHLAFSGNSSSFNVTLTESPGTYFLVTKAFDARGASFRSNRTIQVYNGTPGSTCSTAPSSATICLPSTATSSSPVHIVANGNTRFIPTAAQLYIDGKLVINDTGQEATFAPGGSSSIDTMQSLSNGTHNLVFKLYDDSQNVYTASKSITVN